MSNVQFPRVIDRAKCPVTGFHLQIVNAGHGTLKIEHPTSIANMLVAAGSPDEMSQHWRMILLGFDPLMLPCADGYSKFRRDKYPPSF